MATPYMKNQDRQPVHADGNNVLVRVKRKSDRGAHDEEHHVTDDDRCGKTDRSHHALPGKSHYRNHGGKLSDRADDNDDDHDDDVVDAAENIAQSLSKLIRTRTLRQRKVSRLFEAKRQQNSSKIKPRSKEKVFIRVVFIKVGEIDTVKEVYSTDIFIQARWREPTFDGNYDEDSEKIKWTNYWNPHIYVDNCVGDPKETISYTLMHNTKRKEAYVVERRRLKGTYLENFELDQFPFDTQALTVLVLSALSNHEVQFEEDSTELSTVNVQSFVDKQEWLLYSNVNVSKQVVDLVYEATTDTYKHPSISFTCHASRRYGFYVWNIMFVMFCRPITGICGVSLLMKFWISAMSFVPWTIAVSKPENRIQVTFILLLTTITFKFAVSASLPRISYLTYLDYYILVKMVFMGFVGVWHAIAPYVHQQWSGQWPGSTDPSWPDKGMLIALSVLFVAINVTFITVIYNCAIKARRKFEKADRYNKKRIRMHMRSRESTRHDDVSDDITSVDTVELA